MGIGILARRTLSDFILFASEIFLGLLIVGLPSLVLQRLLVYHIPYTYIPHLIFYIFPECLQMLLPLSLMGGSVITFARMGAENEIMILKASGIQPVWLICPLLALSFILSFGAWYINDISAISRERGIRNVLLNGAEDIVKGILKSTGEINTPQLRIKADSVDKDYLYGVSVHYMPSPTATPIDIEAQRARIQTDKLQWEFIIELADCRIREGNAQIVTHRKVDHYSIPISAFLTQDAASNITNAPMGQMFKELAVLNDKIKETEDQIAGDAAAILLTGEYSQYDSESMKRCHKDLKDYSNTYRKAIIEPYRRFTMGFACLCLVILSAPLAIYYSKIGIYYNVFFSAAPTISLFAILFVIGLNLGKQGAVPPWTICLADIVPFILGVIMIKYVSNK